MKIKIMGIDIDIVDIDTLKKELCNYLTNEYLNIIFFASAKMVEWGSKDDNYRKLLERADYLLPGEELLLSLHHVDILRKSGMLVKPSLLSELYLDSVEDDHEEKKIVYFLGKKEQRVENIVQEIKKNYSNLDVQVLYYEALEENQEVWINEINSVAPDILIVAMESPFQENWVVDNSTKLNAKLCIGIGGILDQLQTEDDYIVKKFLKKRKMKLEQCIFRKKLVQYNKEKNK